MANAAMTELLVNTIEQAEWLRQQSLFVATPTIDGKVHGSHYFSKLVLQELCKRYHIRCSFLDKPGDSLVTRARNKLTNQFLKSDMTHMLMVDSDIQFQPPDIITLMLISQDHKGIVGVPYPKKQINWARIAQACNNESQHPIELMPSTGADYVINALDPEEWKRDGINLSKPIAIRHLGAGYLLVPRYVFEQLSAAGRKERELIQTLIGTGAFYKNLWTLEDIQTALQWINRRGPIVDEYILSREEQQAEGQERLETFFEAKVSPEVGQHGDLTYSMPYYPSEDWWFCDRWRELGGTVWACPWMKSVHIGNYEYQGDMPAIAKVEQAL